MIAALFHFCVIIYDLTVFFSFSSKHWNIGHLQVASTSGLMYQLMFKPLVVLQYQLSKSKDTCLVRYSCFSCLKVLFFGCWMQLWLTAERTLIKKKVEVEIKPAHKYIG